MRLHKRRDCHQQTEGVKLEHPLHSSHAPWQPWKKSPCTALKMSLLSSSNKIKKKKIRKNGIPLPQTLTTVEKAQVPLTKTRNLAVEIHHQIQYVHLSPIPFFSSPKLGTSNLDGHNPFPSQAYKSTLISLLHFRKESIVSFAINVASRICLPQQNHFAWETPPSHYPLNYVG